MKIEPSEVQAKVAIKADIAIWVTVRDIGFWLEVAPYAYTNLVDRLEKEEIDSLFETMAYKLNY